MQNKPIPTYGFVVFGATVVINFIYRYFDFDFQWRTHSKATVFCLILFCLGLLYNQLCAIKLSFSKKSETKKRTNDATEMMRIVSEIMKMHRRQRDFRRAIRHSFLDDDFFTIKGQRIRVVVSPDGNILLMCAESSIAHRLRSVLSKRGAEDVTIRILPQSVTPSFCLDK